MEPLNHLWYCDTQLNISEWFNKNQGIFHPLDKGCIGYQLVTDEPELFEGNGRVWTEEQAQKKSCTEELETLVFTGKTKEEIFIKMYKYCLLKVKWQNGQSVNLIDYAMNLILLNDIEKDNDKMYLNIDDLEILLNKENIIKNESLILEYIMDSQLDFYGFYEWSMSDDCFRVVPIFIL